MRRALGMAVALFVMGLGLWLSNHDFLGPSNAINTLRQISMLGIFAMGIGFVIIGGGIDLSIGSMIGLTGVLVDDDPENGAVSPRSEQPPITAAGAHGSGASPDSTDERDGGGVRLKSEARERPGGPGAARAWGPIVLLATRAASPHRPRCLRRTHRCSRAFGLAIRRTARIVPPYRRR